MHITWAVKLMMNPAAIIFKIICQIENACLAQHNTMSDVGDSRTGRWSQRITTRWRVRRLAMPTETIATSEHVNMNCLHLESGWSLPDK